MTEKRNGRGSAGERTAAKREKPARKKKKSGRRWFAWFLFTGATAAICAIVGYLLIVLNGERILASNQSAFNFAESTVIYDANGKEAARLAAVENREYVEYSKIPPLLREAFVATEDKRFYEHDGVDFWAIGRAVVKDVIARSAVEGGSTITQQLAKNMFLSHEKTFFRKASEASIAVALENNLTKDEILELYLNRIYFGKGAHGVLAASKFYFGKSDLSKLDLWEVATLAGIPKAPNVYNPIANHERSQERMAVVLKLMLDQGLVTAEQVEEAKAQAAAYQPPASSLENAATQAYPAFVDYVVNEVEREYGLTEEQLLVGGYNIYTTLNVKAQRIVERELDDPANFEESPDDQIVQGAIVIIDHRTGEIEAIGGGRDYQKKGTNRVLDTRQPGSAFKPIAAYGPALETGEWFPWSTLRDDKKCYGDYCPTDSNRVKYVGPISMRESLKESRNASAVWLLNEIGVGRGLDFAKRLGFDLGAEDRNLTIALGGLTHGVSPMQMATAYSVFANGGKSVDPHAVVRIEDKKGETVHEYVAPRAKQLIKQETAWYLTEMMQAVLEKGGTGTRARIDRPVAGKTGTTEHGVPGLESSANRDAWFVGYTPEWTAAVWMGYPRTDEKHVLKNSSAMSAALFAKVMGEALEGAPDSSFKKPAGVKSVAKPPTVGGFSVAWSEADLGIRLAWSKQAGNDLVYNVYRKESSETAFALHTQTSETVAVDMAVEAGKTYEYYVAAYDREHGVEGDSSTKRSAAVPDLTTEPPVTEEPVEGGEDGLDGILDDILNPGNDQGAEDGGNNEGAGAGTGTGTGTGGSEGTGGNDGGAENGGEAGGENGTGGRNDGTGEGAQTGGDGGVPPADPGTGGTDAGTGAGTGATGGGTNAEAFGSGDAAAAPQP